QVTSEATVDLVLADGSPAEEARVTPKVRRAKPRRRAEPAWSGDLADAAFAPRWLRPRNTTLRLQPQTGLEATVGEERHAGVFAVRALPASCPERFISLRHADADGQEHEIGIVADLTEWPAAARSLVEQALERRYFIRQITAVEQIELNYGLL